MEGGVKGIEGLAMESWVWKAKIKNQKTIHLHINRYTTADERWYSYIRYVPMYLPSR